ncbi:alpha/beta fold hydrolase [Stutzerimonas stutzeri]|uniref:alpha/beta fold hydrolase n=1 Tax=Stutzerimonas stutzeri TaxID=316 RepID=UPI00210C0CB3|nr:alpha/beta fold hydrolase [Stutzerimonas stutzeri]MCQ4258641.1 alpha/beta fold hydrolase [Stutzerimonas stutzeri]
MTDLVLLHGGQHGSWCWKFFVDAIKQREALFERVICLDMPGCGTKRGRDVSTLTFGDIIKELNDELRAANVRDAVLLGHSIAGVLLPMMATEDQSLYSRLVYLATAVPAEGQSIMELLGSSLHGQNPEEVGWPLNPVTTAPVDMQKAMFGADMSDAQLTWLLGEAAADVTPPAIATQPAAREGYANAVPSVYILTARDGILPPAWQRKFAERLGCEDLIEIDTPHEPFVTDPELLGATLAEWMISRRS